MLPEDGYVSLCKDEAEEAVTLWETAMDDYGDWTDFMESLSEFMEKIHPITLYGFLAIDEQLNPDSYGSVFSP